MYDPGNYEVGKVYIWQNITGYYHFINGWETTVTGPVQVYADPEKNTHIGWPTDTSYDGYIMMACAGLLRPKNEPEIKPEIIEEELIA